jgi:hypothetical protein
MFGRNYSMNFGTRKQETFLKHTCDGNNTGTFRMYIIKWYI